MTSYALAPDVAWVDGSAIGLVEPLVCVARVPEGPPRVLRDWGWAIWVAAAAGGSEDAVIEHALALGPDTGDATEDVSQVIRTFLAELVQEGFLVHDP